MFPNVQVRAIIDFLEPDYERSKLTKYMQVLLIMLTFYPIVNTLILFISLFIIAGWCSFVIAVVVLYTFIKPLI